MRGSSLAEELLQIEPAKERGRKKEGRKGSFVAEPGAAATAVAANGTKEREENEKHLQWPGRRGGCWNE